MKHFAGSVSAASGIREDYTAAPLRQDAIEPMTSMWFPWQHRSVRSRWRRSGELTLTAIDPTVASAAGATMNVRERLDSGSSRYRAAVSRRKHPVPTAAADSSRPQESYVSPESCRTSEASPFAVVSLKAAAHHRREPANEQPFESATRYRAFTGAPSTLAQDGWRTNGAGRLTAVSRRLRCTSPRRDAAAQTGSSRSPGRPRPASTRAESAR